HQDANSAVLHFTDVTKSSGLTSKGWGMGIAAGDFDNDGLPDLYVTGYGHNVLYRNLGGCKFENVTEKAGVSAGGFSTGAAWADLFVTNDSGWNFLYHNRQNGTFEEVGIPSGTGLGPFGQNYGNMAADFADFDHDGRLDLFVMRFGNQPASLYWNRGSQFVDIA